MLALTGGCGMKMGISSTVDERGVEMEALGLPYGPAICYSGYREGQSPLDEHFPSHDEVAEDLAILQAGWRYLRLYDCSQHASTVLEIIRSRSLNFKVLLGADMRAEVNNPGCPWGAEYDAAALERNRVENEAEIGRMIDLARRYPEAVCAVSVGNEATVEWTDHMVPVERLISFVRRIRDNVRVPITFCENYVPWIGKLEPLAAELDFISLHTYPVWEYQPIENALAYTRQNYGAVLRHYTDKPVVITEAGWTTTSNGRGIDSWNASQENQASYYAQLTEWTDRERILTFVFEAFDEPWKGSDDPGEPEKHWGIFNVDRTPKLVMRDRYPGR